MKKTKVCFKKHKIHGGTEHLEPWGWNNTAGVLVQGRIYAHLAAGIPFGIRRF